MDQNFHNQIDQAAEAGDLPALIKLLARLLHDVDPELKQQQQIAAKIQEVKDLLDQVENLPRETPLHINGPMDATVITEMLKSLHLKDFLVPYILVSETWTNLPKPCSGFTDSSFTDQTSISQSFHLHRLNIRVTHP